MAIIGACSLLATVDYGDFHFITKDFVSLWDVKLSKITWYFRRFVLVWVIGIFMIHLEIWKSLKRKWNKRRIKRVKTGGGATSGTFPTVFLARSKKMSCRVLSRNGYINNFFEIIALFGLFLAWWCFPFSFSGFFPHSEILFLINNNQFSSVKIIGSEKKGIYELIIWGNFPLCHSVALLFFEQSCPNCFLLGSAAFLACQNHGGIALFSNQSETIWSLFTLVGGNTLDTIGLIAAVAKWLPWDSLRPSHVFLFLKKNLILNIDIDCNDLWDLVNWDWSPTTKLLNFSTSLTCTSMAFLSL